MFMELFPCRRSPLECASYGGFVNCMAVLLENGCDVNTRDNEARLAGTKSERCLYVHFFQGITSIHWASASGHLEAIRLLFEYGANPNFMEVDGDRLTPLDYAIINDHQEAAQVRRRGEKRGAPYMPFFSVL